MTAGAPTLNAAPRKTSFRDRHEHRVYVRSLEIARRIADDPRLIDQGRRFMERHMRDDPHQRVTYELWSALLDLPAAEVANRLIADDEMGSLLRETAPVFVVMTPHPVEPFV